MTPVAALWVFNFDADDELAAGGASYAPSAAMRARSRALRPFVAALMGPGDVVLDEDGPPDACATGALTGRAWCPTPRALALLRRAGAVPEPAPPFEALRRVNDRAFAFSLADPLPGSALLGTAEEIEAHLARPPLGEGGWLLKRAFGFAGRGRRKVRGGALADADRRWIAASLRRGDGLLIEPWVSIALEAALHGYVAPSGALRLGAPTIQTCDVHGAWAGTRLAVDRDLAAGERAALAAHAERAASALHRAGYFGPFGVDAYRWWSPWGAPRFRPLGELNARYSMGWAVGMGGGTVSASAP